MESALALPTKLSLTAGLVSLPYDAYVTIQLEQRLENADDRPITCMSILGCFLGRISVFVLKTSVAYYLFANTWFSLRQGKYMKWPFLITKVGSNIQL